MTIKKLIQKYSPQLDPNEVDAVLALALHKNKEYLYRNPEKKMSRSQINAFKKYLRLRRENYPLAYLKNSKDFYSLEFRVSPQTLVPRPETELLVDQALLYLKGKKEQKVLDIGTGSGCIIIAIAKNAPDNIFVAGDISAAALRVAKTNTRKNGLKNNIKFIKSDLLQNIPTEKFNVVVANLPYLIPQQVHKPTLIQEELSIKKEPILALVGGADGLKHYVNFFADIKKYLATQYLILIEIDPDQSQKIKEIIKNNLPKSKIEIIKDLAGWDRVVKIYN
ncbi:MAG: peptide chain release factor N(5)-glutamine methyltransferase [Parcubacteria group bacterium]|nr:MAG: peptide chain release factor N(5)-glutamine methyltransferase [Parcubacteria group bacterium]